MDAELQILRRRRAFLIILVIFIAFCALAFLLLLPTFLLTSRENARRERCDYNLSAIYRAVTEYCDAYGTYPPAFVVDSKGEKLHSWRVLLLPYLHEEELYSQIRLDEPWDSEWNRQFWTKTPNVYRCASEPLDEGDSASQSNRCSFSCVLGPNAVFPDDGSTVKPDDVVDGLSSTIMLVELKKPVNWMDPNSDLTIEQILADNAQPIKERANFGSWHGKGEFVLFCDGNRKFLSDQIDNSVLSLLLGIDDSSFKLEEETTSKPETPSGE